jgi:hypothetical protein
MEARHRSFVKLSSGCTLLVSTSLILDVRGLLSWAVFLLGTALLLWGSASFAKKGTAAVVLIGTSNLSFYSWVFLSNSLATTDLPSNSFRAVSFTALLGLWLMGFVTYFIIELVWIIQSFRDSARWIQLSILLGLAIQIAITISVIVFGVGGL